ncbi:NrfD/PsrC family molybdoenzyme membrane anchor subunit [Nocardiopsis tropica]|uniref:NrfD/PsrC family molybdoenzyme membrane anchor subunit n=1 Tax=Nocardiopsis tropica TaxID=109330 RepID=A0ABU7KLU1_9ACTN|nr:NrfD/PsrC family molybdoenzyme membrane anchor subunit [Nocardiopsis umidischolae]MEE2050261.1 NrfD/PsrC family molybdoenzyme membrane anchor subunit [Nocardiopsis umidischolae]
MSTSDVTREGVRGQRPGRDAVTGSARVVGEEQRRRHGGRRGEPTRVPDAEFRSYYGRPVLNQVVWEASDIGGYLFLGGLAGASSVLAAGAELTGRDALARPLKYTALAAISGSVVALVHDLGRPERFLNMLRVVKPTSPMSVGTWVLTAYGPLAGVAAVTAATGWFPRIGRAATLGAAAVGPLVATYTAPLVCDTAVPSWHEGYRYMPFLFAASASAAAGGAGLVASPLGRSGPARRAAVGGALVETAVSTAMEHRMGLAGEPYRLGTAGVFVRAARAVLGRRSRAVSALSGAALLAGSACTRLGVFHAGKQSAADPKYTVVPQRRRMAERAAESAAGQGVRDGAPAPSAG